jgi:hypothetical protein
MGLLDTILSTIDAKKRSAKRGIMDMLDNPQQWAGMQANRIQEDRYGGAENAQAMKQYLSKQPYDQKALTAANDALRNAAINESLGAIFVGKGAKTWDKMKEADAMARLAKGEDAATVWKETGVGVAPWDKIARGEISDHAATFSPTKWVKKYENAPNVEQAKQGDAFYHKPLSASYPDLMQAEIYLNPNIKGQGSYHQPNEDIGLGEYIQMNVDRQGKMLTDADWLNRLKDRSSDDNWKKMAEEFYASGDYPTLKAAKKDSFREMRDTQNSIDDIKSGLLYPRNAEKIPKSTLLHENQHAIQQRENFARGGSPDAMALEYNNAIHKQNLLKNDPDYIAGKEKIKTLWDDVMDRDMDVNLAIKKESEILAKHPTLIEDRKLGDIIANGDETGVNAYKRLAGEAEARLAQYRMNLTPEARSALYPYDPTYFKQATGVDIDKLITRGLLDDGPAMSVAPKLTEFEQRHLAAQKNAALPVEQGGLGLPEGNTAMDRARAMGMEDSYHGATKEIDQIDNSKVGSRISSNPSSHLGFFSTPNVKEASRYATDFGKEGANVMPLMVRRGNSFDMQNKQFDDLSMGEFFSKGSTPQERYANAVSDVNSLKDSLVSGGYDSITRFKGRPMEEIVSMNPANIRSRFAAFDPKRRHEADLLGYADPYLLGAMGAGGLLGMGGYSMMNDK